MISCILYRFARLSLETVLLKTIFHPPYSLLLGPNFSSIFWSSILMPRQPSLVANIPSSLTLTLVKKLSFMTILCHFGHAIPNICVNLDASFQTFMSHWNIFLSHWTFLVVLDSITKDHVFYYYKLCCKVVIYPLLSL